MAVRIADHDLLAGLVFDSSDAVFDRFERGFRIVGLESEVDVDAAATVGDPEVGLPELEGHRAVQPHPLAVGTDVDGSKAQRLVELAGPAEGLDLEYDLEEPVDPRPLDVALAEFDAVPVGVVQVQRPRGAEPGFLEVVLGTQAVPPFVVLLGRDREGVVGVEPAPRNRLGSAEDEIGLARGQDDLVLAVLADGQGQRLRVEPSRRLEILDLEREPGESGEHGRSYSERRHRSVAATSSAASGAAQQATRWGETVIEPAESAGSSRFMGGASVPSGMPFRVDERATEFTEIDRFDGGVGWIAHPDEEMQRASHALEHDGEVWVIDPVDVAGIDELFAEFGEVRGVVVTLDRHKRDAADVANRHDVPVYLPAFFDGVSEELEAPVVRFGDELADTGFKARTVVDSRFWQEVALYDPERRTLVVPESVGTADYFLAKGERLGVHPMRRAIPPRDALGDLVPDRVLVSHGAGVLTDATTALETALSQSRTRAPLLYAKTGRKLLPF